MSLGPKKAILVGYFNPVNTTCAVRWGSTIIGPLLEGEATSGYFGDKAFTISALS
jgi:hypothetical protein